MRSIGALYSLGAIFSAYGLGRHLLGHRGGLLFSALLGTNAFYLFHSLNVRMYGPLVFWTILSAWALLEIIGANTGDRVSATRSFRPQILWTILLIGSVTGGLMTFYIFAYYLVALGVLVLILDRKHWWQQGLRLLAGVLITIPWVIWGTRQQLRNADFGRFSSTTGFFETTWLHLKDVLQTLGIHLLLGDWISSIPGESATIAGVVALVLLVACSLNAMANKNSADF